MPTNVNNNKPEKNNETLLKKPEMSGKKKMLKSYFILGQIACARHNDFISQYASIPDYVCCNWNNWSKTDLSFFRFKGRKTLFVK